METLKAAGRKTVAGAAHIFPAALQKALEIVALLAVKQQSFNFFKTNFAECTSHHA